MGGEGHASARRWGGLGLLSLVVACEPLPAPNGLRGPPKVERLLMAAGPEGDVAAVGPSTCDYAAPLPSTSSPTPPTGDDVDHRVLVSALAHDRTAPAEILLNASATVVMFGASSIRCEGESCEFQDAGAFGAYEDFAAIDGQCSPTGPRPMCPEQPYLDEHILRTNGEWPVQRCSGVLIAPRLVATARHCLNFVLEAIDGEEDSRLSYASISGPSRRRRKSLRLGDVAFVAGAKTWDRQIPIGRVARGAQLVYWEQWQVHGAQEDEGDVALIQLRPFSFSLDPVFPGVEPVVVRPSPGAATKIYAIGHPLGLPLTLSGCGTVVGPKATGGFDMRGIDVMYSSSGAPVFDEGSHALVGIVSDDGTGVWAREPGCCRLAPATHYPKASGVQGAARIAELLSPKKGT